MRQQEFTNNRKNGKYHVRIAHRNVFSCAEHQEKATYSLGYKLALAGNKSDFVLKEAEAIADARIKNDNIHWYVPHYTPSIPH